MHSTGPQEELERAARHLSAGQMRQAEKVLRNLLAREPENAKALDQLAFIAHQSGCPQEAVEILEQAIRYHPEAPEFHRNLGLLLAGQRRWPEAAHVLRRLVTLRPDLPDAHYSLGSVLHRDGQIEAAVDEYRQSLALNPYNPDALNNLGSALHHLGRFEEAAAAFREAIGQRPNFGQAHNNLGTVLRDQKRFTEAIQAFKQALAASSTFPEAQANLARTYSELGDALAESGRLEDAIGTYRQSLALRPDDALTLNNLANALQQLDRMDEAIAQYGRALAIRPDYAEAHNNLGSALEAQGRLDEAVSAFRQALALNPDYAEAHNNLGNTLKDAGRLDEAIDCFRKALSLRSDHRIADNLLFLVHYHPEYGPHRIFEQHASFNATFARLPASVIRPHDNDRSPDRKLRIGYVSGDFADHPVGRFFLPLLANHNREQFEVFCYSDVRKKDDMTEQLRGLAAHWRDAVALSNEQLAAVIREERIDILVDLAMHSKYNRLLAFARRPAPVQVTYLAYPGTTGLEAMDYRLTDAYLDPPGIDEACYSEKSVRLPRTFWCYAPPEKAPDAGSLPALGAGHVTFGSLNNFCKINRQVLEVWCRILREVPASELLLHAPEGRHRDDARQVVQDHGVDPARVQFISRMSPARYFAQYQQIDVALDPFPFPGGTTTCDALWMGVPVITLPGQTAVSRAGLSILSNVGLPELVAESVEDYVRLATDLARDGSRLQLLRSGLRQKMLSSPLMDAPQFARDIEAAYRGMWRTWYQSPVP